MTPNLILIFLTFLNIRGHEKSVTLSITARNGNNGKAIAQEHLLVFTGKSRAKCSKNGFMRSRDE